jgi:hypothetical protein
VFPSFVRFLNGREFVCVCKRYYYPDQRSLQCGKLAWKAARLELYVVLFQMRDGGIESSTSSAALQPSGFGLNPGAQPIASA